MKRIWEIATVSGLMFAIGTLVGTQLSAQGGPAVLAVVEIDAKDDDAFVKSGYPANVGNIMNDGGGTYVVRGTKIHAVEGEAPKRVAITRFENADKAKALFKSDVYKENRKLVDKLATFRVYLAELLN